MAKSLTLYFREPLYLFPTTTPTNARWIRDSSRFRMSCIPNKEVLNFQYPARLYLPQTDPKEFMVSQPYPVERETRNEIGVSSPNTLSR